MRFEWDENKNQSNQRKHGVSFSKASEVFNDPHHLISIEGDYEGEERWQTLGMTSGFAILVVVNVFRENDGGETIRIISARRAQPQERAFYARENG